MTDPTFNYSHLTLDELRTLAASPQVGAMEAMPRAFHHLADRVGEVAELLTRAQADLPNWWKGAAAEQAAATLGRAAAEARDFQDSALGAATAVGRCATIVAEQQHQMMSVPELPEPGVSAVIERPTTAMDALEAARQNAAYQAARERAVQVVNGIAAQYVETRSQLATISTFRGEGFKPSEASIMGEASADASSRPSGHAAPSSTPNSRSASKDKLQEHRIEPGSNKPQPREMPDSVSLDQVEVPFGTQLYSVSREHSTDSMLEPGKALDGKITNQRSIEGLSSQAKQKANLRYSSWATDGNESHRVLGLPMSPRYDQTSDLPHLASGEDESSHAFSDLRLSQKESQSLGHPSWQTSGPASAELTTIQPERQAPATRRFSSGASPMTLRSSSGEPRPGVASSARDQFLVDRDRSRYVSEMTQPQAIGSTRHNTSIRAEEANSTIVPPYANFVPVRREHSDRNPRPAYLKENKSAWTTNVLAAPPDGIITPEFFRQD